MAYKKLARALLASAVIVTGMSFSVPDASAFQLHELLFSREKRKEMRQRRNPEPVIQKRKKTVKAKPRKPIKRISGPQYYTYKAPQMAVFTLAGLTTASVGQSGELGLPTMDFEAQRFKEAVRYSPTLKISIEEDIAKAVTDYYSKKPAFVWSRGSSVTTHAKDVAAMLNSADKHGLNPEHYAIEVPSDAFSFDDPKARAAELLSFETKLTAYAIRYAQDMKDGEVNPNKISGYHDFTKNRLSANDALEGLTSGEMAPADYLTSLVPNQPHYAMLQDELVKLRGSTETEIVLPPDLLMKPGNTVEELPLLMKAMERKMGDETRTKHQVLLSAYAGETLYKGELVELVRDVQRDLGVAPDGIVGPKTVSRLGGQSLASKIERVKLTLERLRWHPENYGKRQVLINQPEYRVRYMEDGETKLAMRAVVGKPANQTNFFHDEIETVVFNPYWGVPQSIIVNEMLPKLRRDPGYLDRAGYVVSTHGGKRIASSNINWAQYAGPVPFNVRQKPGPKNALGELKILFPNRHAIYMHDTPAKNLFQRDNRAYSHGCVRLEDPRAMAAAVLGKSREYVASQLGGGEKGEKVSEKIPVFISYFTAWPNDAGQVEYHPDMYKRDMYLGRALEAVAKARAASS
ncbi:L,D-transpeptidase family protein [Ahrensia marina]|uniref:L,D-TPase catalytic domain-containing protein n=1 Tax=Ahrensia marina TaxID=1514904 RepID=A0A0N0VM69_9HYPH|nr:L,D-transpeptidase family protein [Ahrensia marina]KPB02221.1 hypothetical protein SU32_04275 [Ahrensia marina]